MIFDLVSKIPYFKQALFSLFLAMSILTGVVWMQNNSLREDVVALEIANTSLQAKANKVQRDLSIQKTLLEQSNIEKISIENNNKQLNAQLEEYKQRENVVIKKPSLVERRINNATNSVLHEWECIPDCKDRNN